MVHHMATHPNTVRHAAELRAELARQQISSRELARRVGETPTWVHRRVAGITEISIGDLDRFAKALGVSMADLMPRESA